MNAKYPNLLSPGYIGKVELRNKTVMAAMGMSQAENGFVNKAVLNHYAERAKGGVGAIVVEVGSYTMWKYDGMTIPTDVPPFLYQGTLRVGLRQIGNALNYKVGWDEANRVVSLDRAKPNYDLKQHNVFDRSVY